jgi:hypothetical protein
MAAAKKKFVLCDGTIEPDLPLRELIIWYCERIERKLDSVIATTKTEPSRT